MSDLKTRRVIKRDNASPEKRTLRAFLAEKATILKKYTNALINWHRSNDEESKARLDIIHAITKKLNEFVARGNFNGDTTYAKAPLQKRKNDCTVVRFEGNGLVNTTWTKTYGGPMAFLTNYEEVKSKFGIAPKIHVIDITSLAKETPEHRKIILAMNTGYVRTSEKDEFGDYVNYCDKFIEESIVDESRNNIGKLIAVAKTIEDMVAKGFIPLMLPTDESCSLFNANNDAKDKDDGDVPPGHVVLPFVDVREWDILNTVTNNFYGKLEDHMDFMFHNAEKHAKYQTSDYYDLEAMTNVIVINPDKIEDAELKSRLGTHMDGYCFAHSKNKSFRAINKQIIKAYRETLVEDDEGNMVIDRAGLHQHLLGIGCFAFQARGSVDASETTRPKSVHMLKGVVGIWRNREFKNIVAMIERGIPELKGKITKDTIFMTTDVAKKVPVGSHRMVLRVNAFAYDKTADDARFGLLFGTRTQPTQVLAEAVRLLDETPNMTMDDMKKALADSANMNHVTSKAIRNFTAIVDKLTKKKGETITVEEAYENINALLLEVSDKKTDDDIVEDSNDARFIGFNEWVSIARDLALAMSMISTKAEVKEFHKTYSKLLGNVVRTALRIRLNKDNCGYVAKSYLIPETALWMASAGKFKMKPGTYVLGHNVNDDKVDYAYIMRAPVLWPYGLAPYRKNNMVLTTNDYDLSYFDGVCVAFGAMTRNSMQSDFDGDTVYVFNMLGFIKRNNKDFVTYKVAKTYYELYWKKIVPAAKGLNTYVGGQMEEIPNDVLFNIVNMFEDANEKMNEYMREYAIINPIVEAVSTDNSGSLAEIRALPFTAGLRAVLNTYAGIEISEFAASLTSTLYRESFGKAIGLGDTKLSIATAIIYKEMTNAMIEYALFNNDSKAEYFGELDMIAARMAQYLQSMIEAIKHDTAPMIDVNKASKYLIKEALRIMGQEENMLEDIVKIGDIFADMRKMRLYKFADKFAKKSGDYKYFELKTGAAALKGSHLFTALDKLMLDSAIKLDNSKIALAPVYETVMAADPEKLTGAIGSAMVQKLVGSNIFAEANKLLYPENHKDLDADVKGAVYNLPHRLTLVHSLVLFVAVAGKMRDSEFNAGTNAVIKALRDRILTTIKFVHDTQAINDKRFEEFVEAMGNSNLFESTAGYYNPSRGFNGNVYPDFNKLFEDMGITTSDDFEKMYSAINDKVAKGVILTNHETMLWHEMQMRINEALSSNKKTFLGVFGALVNKFQRDTLAYFKPNALDRIYGEMKTARVVNDGLINVRQNAFGVSADIFTLELFSTIFVYAATSGNKSAMTLLGPRLTKMFMDMYDVDWIGATKESRAGHDGEYKVAIPAEVIEYVMPEPAITKIGETPNRTGGINTKYEVIVETSSIDVEHLTKIFAGVTVVVTSNNYTTLHIETWFKKVEPFVELLSKHNVKIANKA